MRVRDAVNTIKNFSCRQSAIVLGPPGVGKTAIGHYVAEETDAFLCVRDLCSHLAEDLIGTPYRDQTNPERQITRYASLDWLYALNDHERAVLVLDDLPAASQSVQVAVFRLMQEREVGGFKLGPNVRVMATGNRPTDQSNASALPAALRNKAWVGHVEADIEEWLSWAKSAGVCQEVIAYLKKHPSYLSQLPNQALEVVGTFATPRAWANLSEALKQPEMPISIEMVEGFIGKVGQDFFKHYSRLRKIIPDPKAVLDDPIGTVPTPIADNDVMTALMQSLGEYAASMQKNDASAVHKFVKAIAHVTHGNNEFAQAAIFEYLNNGGNAQELVDSFKKQQNVSPQMKDLVKFIQDTLKA